MNIRGNFLNYLAMLKMMSTLTHASRRNFVKDCVPTYSSHFLSMIVRTLRRLSVKPTELKLVWRNIRSRSNALVKLAHPRVSLFRNVGCGFRTMFITDRLQHQGHHMLHLVCLHRRDRQRFRVDSSILWLLPIMTVYAANVDSQVTVLSTVARISHRMHHVL